MTAVRKNVDYNIVMGLFKASVSLLHLKALSLYLVDHDCTDVEYNVEASYWSTIKLILWRDYLLFLFFFFPFLVRWRDFLP